MSRRCSSTILSTTPMSCTSSCTPPVQALSALLPEFLGWWYESSDDPWVSDKGRVAIDLPQALPLINLVREFNPTRSSAPTSCPPGCFLPHRRGPSRRRTGHRRHGLPFSRLLDYACVSLVLCRPGGGQDSHGGLGLPGDRIHVTASPSIRRLRKRWMHQPFETPWIEPDLPTLLVAGGALGLSPALAVVRRLLELDTTFQASSSVARTKT